MAQQFSLRHQAEEIGLRVIEVRDFISKNRGKKPTEMLGCMEIRADCLEEARDTLFWLSENADLVREAAGAPKTAKKADPKPKTAEKPTEAPKTAIPEENAEKPLPEGWEVVNGRVFNEDGDLVPNFFTAGA